MNKCACKGAFLDRLIQPAILLLLAKEDLHGFSIYKKLIENKSLDYAGIDPTGLYRSLKKMEKAGLVLSTWDRTLPAQSKQIYSMTAEGTCCLENWEETLLSYKASMEQLIHAIQEARQKQNGA